MYSGDEKCSGTQPTLSFVRFGKDGRVVEAIEEAEVEVVMGLTSSNVDDMADFTVDLIPDVTVDAATARFRIVELVFTMAGAGAMLFYCCSISGRCRASDESIKRLDQEMSPKKMPEV
jgi:hypothetical protein